MSNSAPDPRHPVDPAINSPGREGLTGTAPASLYAPGVDREQVTIAPNFAPALQKGCTQLPDVRPALRLVDFEFLREPPDRNGLAAIERDLRVSADLGPIVLARITQTGCALERLRRAPGNTYRPFLRDEQAGHRNVCGRRDTQCHRQARPVPVVHDVMQGRFRQAGLVGEVSRMSRNTTIDSRLDCPADVGLVRLEQRVAGARHEVGQDVREVLIGRFQSPAGELQVRPSPPRLAKSASQRGQWSTERLHELVASECRLQQ